MLRRVSRIQKPVKRVEVRMVVRIVKFFLINCGDLRGYDIGKWTLKRRKYDEGR